MLKTETPSLEHVRLDEYATPELVNAFIDDQTNAVSAVREQTTFHFERVTWARLRLFTREIVRSLRDRCR